uniref:Abnormal cell migration protein 18-like fibronectin type I domain-containing protein n=1 Tax=Meloidogyne incognita TaxID=6306 RepID=A0A914MMW0_MELIC
MIILILLFLLSLFPILTICAPQKHELSSSYRRLGPRYQVLKEYVFSGQKNVRYETRPSQFLDANGNPLNDAKFTGASSGCIDIDGVNHPEGVEYERQNKHFKYRCVNGQEEVSACIGSDRTNNARIPVGQTLDIKGYWHKCMKYPNGSVIYTQGRVFLFLFHTFLHKYFVNKSKTSFNQMGNQVTKIITNQLIGDSLYQLINSCSTGSNEYRVGEEILLGNLRVVCGDQGYSVVGCYFYNNGQVQKLNVGEQKQVGKASHFCETKGNTLQYYSKGSGGCVKAGKEYAEGAVYLTNHLRYQCQGGIMDVTGCYINENRDLPIGQDIVEKGMVYRCYRLGPKIAYNEYACGFRGTPSCTPPAIPKTPDQVPALGRGLISPGFGSFSIVETNPGSQQVKFPSSVNLGLQKKPLTSEGFSS